LRRQAHKTFGGIVALVGVFALMATIGAHSARPATRTSAGLNRTAVAGHGLASAPATVAVRVNTIPFTPVDFVLLLSGAGVLLMGASTVRRVRADVAPRGAKDDGVD